MGFPESESTQKETENKYMYAVFLNIPYFLQSIRVAHEFFFTLYTLFFKPST